MPKKIPLHERFWSKVDASGGLDACWIWERCRSTIGYGVFTVKGRRVPAHRFAYEHLRDPIPEGLVSDHLCRVRHCVNPWHIELVTQRENVLRGLGVAAECARKTHCPAGHPYNEANTYRRPSDGARLCRACHRRT